MAAGEPVPNEVVPAAEALPDGTVVMPNGRISAARTLGGIEKPSPFSPVQLAQLDEALTLASRTSGLAFSVYLGDLGGDSRAYAEALHSAMPVPAKAVVIAVSPKQRVVEVVTGADSSRRLPDRSCRLAVMSMVASFKEGDLIGGLVSGLRMLSDQAGQVHHR